MEPRRLLLVTVMTIGAVAATRVDAQAPGDDALQPGQTFTECRNCPEMIVLPPGNFEWTEDCYEADRAHAPADGSANKQGNCANRVFRGGTFLSNPYMQRSARRGAPYPATQRGRNYLGFRVAKTLD